jgi:hypothetical protein
MKTLLSAACTLALLTGIAAVVAPDFLAGASVRIEGRIADLSAADCAARPVACLTAKQRDLAAVGADLDAAIAEIAKAKTDAQAERKTVRARQALGRLYLEEARRQLTLNPQTATDIPFVGTRYTYDQLRAQTQVLFDEAAALDLHVRTVDETATRLEAAQRELMTRRTAVRSSLDLAPAQIALMGAQKISADIMSDLRKIDETLAMGRDTRQAADDLMRSSTELANDAKRTAFPDARSFEAWLKASPGPLR